MDYCFNCGCQLKVGSLRCPSCGYMPDVDFMKKCPNLQGAICSLKNSMCGFMGAYQTCPTKNSAEASED